MLALLGGITKYAIAVNADRHRVVELTTSTQASMH